MIQLGRRALAGGIAASLVLLGVVVPVGTAAATGTPNITLAKTAPATVLAGDQIPYTLTASNPTAQAGYNVLFRDVLPPGVSYVAGSTTPADDGDPTVYANQPSAGSTTLIWSNVADLQPQGSYTLGFKVQLVAATFPVNTTLTDVGNVYVNSDPRIIPNEDSTGTVVPSSYTGNADSPTTTTTVTAVKVAKSQPEPENEVTRGVHGSRAPTYTLVVTNNSLFATNGSTVTDYIPAGMEFLGCGGVDNSGVEEYPGSGLLTAVPVVPANCPTPTSVTTVKNPAGQPAGVYTQVVWTLGNLAAGAVTTIKYKAGIPLRANTFPGPANPTANLSNNTGPSTAEGATEQAMTNTAVVSGTYTGPVKTGTSATVTGTDSVTVTAEDFAIDKGPSGTFVQGGIVTWSLRLRTGEYRAVNAITVTDTLPDGLCPLGSANYATGAPAECDPVAGQNPSLPYASPPVNNADGTTTVVFAGATMPADSTQIITFPARERMTYTDGTPTVGGDSFTNTVKTQGTSTATPAAPDPAPNVTVFDDSQATLTSQGPSVDKEVSVAVLPPGTLTCAGATYIDTTTSPDNRPVYKLGDRVCFKLRVDFPTSIETRNPVVTDVLPATLDYEAGSVAAGPANTVDTSFNEAAAVAGTAYPTWLVGTPNGANRYVLPGGVFEQVFSAVVNRDAVAGAPFTIQGNIMKLRAVSTPGSAFSLRAEADLKIAAGPRLAITKGVAGIAAPYSNGPNVDNVQVKAGTVVRYRLDITNTGQTPAQSTAVRDVLPAGITCASVANISNGGSCAASSGGITTPVVVWNLPATDIIAAGASRLPLTYDVTIPAGVSVAQTYTNTAGITSYQSPTNRGTTVSWVPTSNIDPAATPTPNTPAATDTSNVFTPGQTLAKTNTSSLVEPGNDATSATIGETVNYSLTVTIPAGTTVYDGLLNDPVPAGQTYVAGSAAGTLDGAALPPGYTLSASGTAVSLTFPTSQANASAVAQVIVVTYQAVIQDVAVNTRPAQRPNVATLTSNLSHNGVAIPPITATRNVPIVEPNLTVAKKNDATGGLVVSGQVVTYTVTTTNTAGTQVSTAHDVTASDVIPVGLSYIAGSASNGGTYDAPTRTVSWTLPDIAAGANAVRTYQVTVDPGAISGNSFVNAVTAKATSMPGAVTGERTYTKTTSNTVNVQTPATTKTVTPGTATIGDSVTFTVNVTVPKNVTVYDTTVLDTLPAGLVYTGTLSATCSVSPCPAVLPADFRQAGQRLGWYFGDPTVSTVPYTLTVVYTARVANIAGNTNGTSLPNSAVGRWSTTNLTFPATGLPANTFWNKVTNTAVAAPTVIEPALVLSKAVDQPTVDPGTTRTYTLTVKNNGTAPAYAATVVDTIPNLLLVTVGTASNGTAVLSGATATGGGKVTWTIPGPLPVGGSVTLTYTAVLAASAQVPDAAALTNSATLQTYTGLAGGPGANGRSYTGNTTTAVVTAAFPHVTVAKTVASGAKSGTAFIGTSFGWKLVLTNTSAVPAYAVGTTDTLPAGWTYDAGSAVVTPQGGSPVVKNPTISGQTLTWAGLGTVPAGQTITITFTATPSPSVVTNPGVGPANPNVNAAVPIAQDATGATGNLTGSYAGPADTASAIIGSADLSVVKSHTGSFTAGVNGVYTLTVHNGGPSDAAGPVTVTDTLPAGLTFVSGGGNDGWNACTAAGQAVTCVRPAGVTNGTTTVITLTVAVDPAVTNGTYVNTATIASPTYDPVPGNNTSTDPTTIVTSADLDVHKALSGSTTVTAGHDVTYTIDLVNHGPSVSRGPITITDALPSGTTFVSAGGGSWVCNAPGAVITCTLPSDLAVNASAPQITVVVHLASSTVGSLTNIAHVTGTTPDPNSANDTSIVITPITTSADIVLTKSHVGTFEAGSPGVYTMKVDNLGPSAAQPDLTVVDSLPAGLTFTGTGGEDGWTCSAVGQDVTCLRHTALDSGASTTFTLDVHVDSGAVLPIVNTATASSTTSDPNPANNTDSDSTQFTTSADISIVKSHVPEPVEAGGQVTYTLAVHNGGPSDAAGPITVVDTLPAGLTVAAVPPAAGWSCPFAVGDTSLTCTRAAALVAGADATPITVVVAVDPSQPAGSVTNSATATSTTSDPDNGNNTADDPTTVITRADLALSKVAADPTLAAGQGTSFTLGVTNNGPSDAAGPITVTDTLPVGMTFVSGGGSNGWASCDATGQSVSCVRAASLPVGGVAGSLVIDVQVPSGTPAATLTNSAVVGSPTVDPVPGNNTATAPVDVTTSADLALTKTHRETNLKAGDAVTFDLVATNAGPSDAVAPITVVDTLPAKVRFTSADAPWACLATGDPLVGQTVTCTLAAALTAGTVVAPHAAPTLTLHTLIDVDLAPATVTNTAVVSSTTPDPDPANNTATDDVPIGVLADLSIVKSHTGDLTIGSNATYSIVVTNNGPSEATAVVVDDPMPAGLTFVSAVGAGWDCTASTATALSCSRPTADPGTSYPLTLTAAVDPNAYPTVTNTATVSALTPDPIPGNNTSSDPATVLPQVDLGITKTHTGTFTVGTDASYQVSVVNHGPTEDPAVITVTDDLPAGLTFVSGVGTGWSCAANAQTVICTRLGLAALATSTFTLTVAVGPAAAPGVTNTVTVTSPTTDTDPTNNTASDPTVVRAAADLAISKTVQGTPAAGGTATYAVVVTNHGPSVAAGPIIVTDVLPTGLSSGAASGSGWACTVAGATISCTRAASLDVTASAPTITVTAHVDAAAGSTVANSATVGGATFDPVTGNNTGVAAIVIGAAGSDLPHTGATWLVQLTAIGLALLALGTALVTRRTRRS